MFKLDLTDKTLAAESRVVTGLLILRCANLTNIVLQLLIFSRKTCYLVRSFRKSFATQHIVSTIGNLAL